MNCFYEEALREFTMNVRILGINKNNQIYIFSNILKTYLINKYTNLNQNFISNEIIPRSFANSVAR